MDLDELARASHTASGVLDERDYPEMPQKNCAATRESIGKLFPSLGYYNIALPVSDSIGQSSLCVGDAIDDIADITDDLKEVLWRYENTSEADALFHFQRLFRSHWGMHLRCLQLYLHNMVWEAT
jgi:hypothetical protein